MEWFNRISTRCTYLAILISLLFLGIVDGKSLRHQHVPESHQTSSYTFQGGDKYTTKRRRRLEPRHRGEVLYYPPSSTATSNTNNNAIPPSSSYGNNNGNTYANTVNPNTNSNSYGSYGGSYGGGTSAESSSSTSSRGYSNRNHNFHYNYQYDLPRVPLTWVILLLCTTYMFATMMTAHAFEKNPEGNMANFCRLCLHTCECLSTLLYNIYHCRLNEIGYVVVSSTDDMAVDEDDEYTEQELQRMKLRPGIGRALEVEHHKAMRKINSATNGVGGNRMNKKQMQTRKSSQSRS